MTGEGAAASWRPQAGDLVSLPPWLPDRPYRVDGVRASLPGWVWLTGQLIETTGHRRPETYHVPTAALRLLPAGEPDLDQPGGAGEPPRVGDLVRLAAGAAPELPAADEPVVYRITGIRPDPDPGWALLEGWVMVDDARGIAPPWRVRVRLDDVDVLQAHWRGDLR